MEDNLSLLETSLHGVRESIMCPICLEDWKSPVTLSCTHIFCHSCIAEALAVKMSCPFCAAPIAKKDISDSADVMDPIVTAVRMLLNYTQPGKLSDNAKDPMTDNAAIERPIFLPGDVVNIAPRLWPGINKPGGAAWILRVHSDAQNYDVKYVLTGAVDKVVPCAYVRIANDIPEERGRRSRQSKPPCHTSTSQLSMVSGGSRSGDNDSVDDSNRSNRCRISKKLRVDDDISPPSVHSSGELAGKVSSTEVGEESTAGAMELILLPSTLTDEQSKLVTQFCEASFSGRRVEVVHRYSETVTHVIVSADVVRRRRSVKHTRRRRDGEGRECERVIKQRTMKYLQALLDGKWIVSVEWLERCLDEGQVVSPEPFEIDRDHKAAVQSSGAPRRARLRKALCHLPNIFENRHVQLFGAYPSPGPTKAELQELLQRGGACEVIADRTPVAVVERVNVSLDYGLKVDRSKHHRSYDNDCEVLIVIVTSKESLDELCEYLYQKISEMRTECSYDFDDFKDHLNGLVYPVHVNWVFDCISNFTYIHPLKCPHLMKI